MQPDFKTYIQQVKANASTLARCLMEKDYKIVTDGTDNHLLLWDLRPIGLTGSKLEKVCDLASITVNKNSVFGDVSAMSPGGVRIGTPALTSRGFMEKDFERIFEFLDRAVKISLQVQKTCKTKMIKEFISALEGNQDIEVCFSSVCLFEDFLLTLVQELKRDVESFAQDFPMPGED